MNHLGQVVVEYNYNATEGEQSYQIDISRLNTGLYILNIRNHKEGSVRKQFIKR